MRLTLHTTVRPLARDLLKIKAKNAHLTMGTKPWTAIHSSWWAPVFRVEQTVSDGRSSTDMQTLWICLLTAIAKP